MRAHRYFRGAGDRRFCFAIEPTFRCLLAELHSSVLLVEAARELECGAYELATILRRAHGSHLYGRRRNAAGRLTNECGVCGRSMERLGFRAWTDDELAPAEMSESERASTRVAARLGTQGPRKTLDSRWFDTKNEAREWAREESRIHLAQTAEAA